MELRSHFETLVVVGVSLTLSGVAFQDSLGGVVSYALVLAGAALAAGAVIAEATGDTAGLTALRL